MNSTYLAGAGGGEPLDTRLTAEQLAQLAAERPDLHGAIAQHPNAYPELVQWIAQQPAASAVASGTVEPSAYSPAPGAPVVMPVPSTGAAGGRRSRGTVLIAAIVAAVLVLGGTATALALTKTWPFGESGSSAAKGSTGGGDDADAAAEIEEGPTFADGAEIAWLMEGSTFGPSASLGGHLPRMMGPINNANRADQPIQLASGILVHYSPNQVPGDAPYGWSLLEPETGEQIWDVDVSGYPMNCDVKDDRSEAVCMLTRVGDFGTFVRFGANGVIDSYDSPLGSVDYVPAGILVQHDGGATTYSLDGRLVEDVAISGTPASRLGNVPGETCPWLYAEGVTLHVGTDCGANDALIEDEAYNWSLIDDEQPMWLIDGSDGVTAVDAASGDIRWTVEGKLQGWYQDPQIVETADGPAVLLESDEFAIVNIRSGKSQTLEGTTTRSETMLSPVAVVAGDQVLVFSGRHDRDETISSFDVYDPSTGLLLAHTVMPRTAPIVYEITGGPHGVLLAHPKCTECSSAEGSGTLTSYEVMRPAESGAESVLPVSDVEVPSSIPVSCPGDTILLAWAELSDGWIVVCGITADRPSYVVYQPSGGGEVWYSLGYEEPGSGDATAAVEWDPGSGRYIAELIGERVLTFDHTMGLVTVKRSSDASSEEATKLLDQQKSVRYIFVLLDDDVRTDADAAQETGAFDVQAPEDTAEDQIRYMIEVLDKAYAGRAAVKDALPKLENCLAGAGGYADSVRAMEGVRDNRAELLDALEAMPVDKIPEGQQLLDDLTDAIRISHRANLEYVSWAEAANESGCAQLSAAGASAAAASDAPKERFAERWNRVVAPKFHVKTFDAWYI